MKLFLEEEQGKEENKTIVKVQELSSKAQSIALKDSQKVQFVHTCYHDDFPVKACKREVL